MFAPNSQRIVFASDQHGKPAIYTMNVERFVEETESERLLELTDKLVRRPPSLPASRQTATPRFSSEPVLARLRLTCLLLIRRVRRELTLCEHRAKNPRIVAPMFAPNGPRIVFASDQHGKPAIYTINVERLVEDTES